MKKEIEEYIISYVFQRFELDNIIKFDHSTRIIVINELHIKVPEIPRKTIQIEQELMNVKIPYYRYDKEIAINKTEDGFSLSSK